MAIIIFNTYRVFTVSSDNTKTLSAHLQNVNRLEKFSALLIDAETGQRGFAITGKEEFLQPYHEAVTQLRQNYRPDSLLSYMPEYTAEIGNLNTMVEEELLYLTTVINRVKAGNTITAAETEAGKNKMDAIRLSVRNISDRELEKLNAVNGDNAVQNKNILIILISGTALCILLLLGYFILINNNSKLQSELSEELIVAKNRINEASKSKSRFLSTMSHELRTPMNGVLGMTSLMMQTPLDEEQKKYISTIHRSGVELLAVINDIIDFSKIETGSVSLEKSSFRLNELLDEVTGLLAPDKKNVTITYKHSHDVPAAIETDQARLRQILINVIANVLKISGQSKVDVNIRCKHCDETISDLIFQVVATGSQLQAQNGGNGFSRLDISAGLGLSISTRLISLLGGNIRLDTNAPQGSTIQFSIKVKPVKNETAVPIPRADALLDIGLQKRFPLRILSADDNDMNQTVITSILRKLGYEVRTAPNGQVAYDLSIEEEFDIVFMDLLMPVMDGLESAKKIRQYHINKPLPVIIGITADASNTERSQWERAGMSDFLTKPYKASEIQALIQKWGSEILAIKNPA